MARISPRDLVHGATLRRLALPALVVVLGLQMLRVYIPSLAWYLRDTVGVGSITLGGIAFATFALGFLAPLVRRLAGSRGALWASAGGLAALRVLEQFSSSPGLDLYVSLAAVALFLIFLGAFVGHSRAADGTGAPARLVGGLILGLALDTLIKGAGGTLDLSWTPTIGAVIVVLALAAGVLWAIAVEPAPLRSAASDVGWSSALPLAGIGSIFLVQAMLLQNQGWVAEVSGIPSPTAFVVLVFGNAALAAGAWLALARPALHRLGVAALAALLLYVALPRTTGFGGTLPLMVLVLQFTLGWALAIIARRGEEPSRTGLARTSVGMTLGMLLYLLLAFVYYVSFDIALPLTRSSVLPLASFVVAVCLLGSLRRGQPRAPQSDPTTPTAAIALAVLGSVIVLLTPSPAPSDREPTGRVMTFNIHSAFDRAGRLDPEAIAQVIEAADPDVVALQEVSRGWLIDGTVDLTYWLARRLGMHVVFSGTADPIWGNALLSRRPLQESGSAPLPVAGTLLPRGFLWTRLDLGFDRPLLVIATHLHHVADEPEPRLEQIPVLLEFWGGQERTILMGDLNAEPDWPEMQLMRQAGLVDSWAEAGEGPGLTWPSDDPFQRIDYIWLSPDLQALTAKVIDSTASDHRAVVAEIAPR